MIAAGLRGQGWLDSPYGLLKNDVFVSCAGPPNSTILKALLVAGGGVELILLLLQPKKEV
jgi:hypothetical protein